MAESKSYSVTLELVNGVDVKVVSNKITVKGPKGEVVRTFTNPRVDILTDGKNVIIKTKEGMRAVKQDKTYVYTYQAHVKNMIYGVIESYEAKLKICSGHFPMQVTADANTVSIKNFLGEKLPRKARIHVPAKVVIKGDIIEVTGIDKDAVAQTAGSIEQATRITNRDRRIFQDGCFIIQKPGAKHDK